jgi:hypothetical protein
MTRHGEQGHGEREEISKPNEHPGSMRRRNQTGKFGLTSTGDQRLFPKESLAENASR